jgi:malate dehydrogenase (oxaloacetate-decarboxylating)
LNRPNEDAINLHRSLRGKIEIHNRVSIDAGFGYEEEEKGTLGLIYTPGVGICSSRNK